MVITPYYLVRVSEMSLVVVQDVMDSAGRVVVGACRNVLELLTEISFRLREILEVLSRVVVTSGNLIEVAIFFFFVLAALYFTPVVWKLIQHQSRRLMLSKGYSSNTMMDGPMWEGNPGKYAGLPFIRASELMRTPWSKYTGSTLAFVYDRGTRATKFREGILISASGSGLHEKLNLEENGHSRAYFLDHMGDVVVVKQPSEAPLALQDVRPGIVKPRARVPASACAVSASGAERSTRASGSFSVRDAATPADSKDYETPWSEALAAIRDEEERSRRPPPSYVSMPDLRMLYNDDISPFMQGAILNHGHLMRVSLYTMDTVVSGAFASKLARGASEVYIVLDKNQVKSPSCKRQWRAMLDLKAWGVHFRARNPKGNMLSCQHEKTWLFDHNLLVVGSWNCSENSTNNCEEACIVSKSPDLIAEHGEHFAMLWSTAAEIDWDEVGRKEENAQAAQLDKQRGRSSSRRR